MISLAISYYGWTIVGTGGMSKSAPYCCTVWNRHFAMAEKHVLRGIPASVVELGPGGSLGVGLAALLTGVHRYYAFDRVRHTELHRNRPIFDEILLLFQKEHGTVPAARANAIRSALNDTAQTNTGMVIYVAPWNGTTLDPAAPGSVDMILSQAVMQYIENIDATYAMFHTWLKPGGIISHQIDFSSHTLARHWNGHWAYPKRTWRFIEGTRPYRLNRQPHSAHIDQLQQAGFHIVCDNRSTDSSGIRRVDLVPEFHGLSDDDLVTRSAFIQAIKPMEI